MVELWKKIPSILSRRPLYFVLSGSQVITYKNVEFNRKIFFIFYSLKSYWERDTEVYDLELAGFFAQVTSLVCRMCFCLTNEIREIATPL